MTDHTKAARTKAHHGSRGWLAGLALLGLLLTGTACGPSGDAPAPSTPDAATADAATTDTAAADPSTAVLSTTTSTPAGAGANAIEPPSLIIVITIDSLRTSRIGAYGHTRPTTPALDAFAEGAHRFTRASSTSSWTKPAMASLFLGLPVHEHLSIFSLQKTTPVLIEGGMRESVGSKDDKVQALARGMAVPGNLEPFHADLEGYTKAAFLNNPHLSAAFGFDRHWDHFQEYEPKVGNRLDVPPPPGKGRAPEIQRDALAFLDAHAGQPMYLWLHHNDVHWPFGPMGEHVELFADDEVPLERLRLLEPKQHRQLVNKASKRPRAAERLSRLYDVGLRAFDDELGTFFQALKDRDLYDDAAIVVTADHGEEFWEHGVFGHGLNLFKETASIPLLLKLPGQSTGTVVDEPVSLLDVGPTVLHLAGRSSDHLPGVSLLPIALDGQRYDRPILSELVRDGYELTLIQGPWKLRVVYSLETIYEHMNANGNAPFQPSVVELYHLEDDPNEQRPVPIAEQRGVAGELLATLEAEFDGSMNYSLRLRQAVESGEADAYTLPFKDDHSGHQRMKAQLEALGYL